MKKLQNNFTTPEQSKLLLEFGVPADCADCYYYDWAWIGGEYEGCSIQTISYTYSFRHECIVHEKTIYPCWSVGRLIEILLLCHKSDAAGIMFDKPLDEVSSYTNIGWCIKVLKSSIKSGDIDFSKLDYWILK